MITWIQRTELKSKHVNKNFRFILFGISLIIYSSVQIASSNTIFYYTTTEAYENVDVSESERLKLGGFVVSDSVAKTTNAENRFTVTDGNTVFTIIFDGFIPDIFQEEMWIILDVDFQTEIVYSDDLLVEHANSYIYYYCPT